MELLKSNFKRQRAAISVASLPLLNAIKEVIAEHEPYWPISLRRVHYSLLNKNVTRGRGSIYVNSQDCYATCSKLLIRARINGLIPWSAIEDEARAAVLPRCDEDRKEFINYERRWFLEGYRRDLMQSQPAHIEVVFEKLTVQSILKPIADKFRDCDGSDARDDQRHGQASSR